MVEFATPEWAEEAGRLWTLLPPAPGAVGAVSLSVGLGPRQEVAFHWRYQDGAAVSGAAGVVPPGSEGPVLALTVAAADARELLDGLPASVAFMRGRLKAAGDGALLLAFLASTETAQFGEWRAQLAALAA